MKDGKEKEDAVRRFFKELMGVPKQMAREVELERIKLAPHNHPRSKIHSEYIVTFTNIEARDVVKSYARGLADSAGKAGLRLELTDALRGSYKILDEHGRATRELYGEGTKRNVCFDDRNGDLMMDLKLPSSSVWHNITIDQARKTKETRDKLELQSMRKGSGVTGAQQRERAKALMLVYSPEPSRPKAIPGGANLIDIEDSFGAEEGAAPDGEGDEEDRDEDSDESMNRLLYGRSYKPTR